MDIAKDISVQLEPAQQPVLNETEEVDVVLRIQPASRFYLKTSTSVGNSEGTASVQGKLRNLFGGAESLEGSATLGTRTKHSYNLSFTTPVFGCPDLWANVSAISQHRDLTNFISAHEGQHMPSIKSAITYTIERDTRDNSYITMFYSIPKQEAPVNMTKKTNPLPLKMVQEPHPRYDPNAPGAVVMKRPSVKHQQIFGRGLPVVDVVLDPELSRILRPHQIEGVKFMYEAVTGMTSVDYGHASTGQGAILADEMGLGKTLQTIALIMTLLRQSCYFSSVTTGMVEKVLIVCPLTLVVNWKREFRKWVGRSSVGLLAVEGDGRSEVERFVSGRQYQVLILGYERLRNCVNELAKAFPSVGLVVCDEGHRLKSKDTKTTKCFDLLPTRRRLLLTGTPIQNDLREFYTMVDFTSRLFRASQNPMLKH
ncbi:helicase [Malassezia caprae]|uniref:Helicase n=1 Tax=Malassezia caprae TaxID=1381934 RepID=A0AAF0E7N6_9BASI|nr:helicase [Malassezia caprae]